MPSTLRALLAPARATTIATALIAMFAAPQAAVAGPVNLVNNGSFEANAIANGSWGIYGNLIGWTGGVAGIELRNNIASDSLGSSLDNISVNAVPEPRGLALAALALTAAAFVTRRRPSGQRTAGR